MRQSKVPAVRFVISILAILFVSYPSSYLRSQDIPMEFQVKRVEKYNFTKTPTVNLVGENYVIEFESEAFCDVTVAVENLEGYIVRHLASGVLGDNAPEPFVKGSLSQKIIWDQKGDDEKYIDDIENMVIRVSLGLKPIFEKTLFWSPYKRIGRTPPVFAAHPGGVLIFEGSGVDSLREYSHEGEYQRTLYPFSKEALKKVSGITKSVFPQSGQELPTKHGPKHRSTFFTFSEGEAHDKYGTAGNALAAHGADIAVVSQGIARIALDGGSHKSGLIGPVCYMESRNKDSTGAPSKIAPLSAAFSQDGKWLYTTGYALSTGGMGDKHWANVVLRSEYGSSNPATVFLGGTAEGTGEGQFRVPLSVAVDTKGRLLVADYMNDRIQVFDENGKFIKSISSNKPVHIGVHPKTGQIFVCSWMIVNRFIKSDKFTIPAKFSRITSVDNPKMEFECDLPLNDYNGTTSWNRTGGLHYKVGFDFWSKEPQIWVLPGLPYTFGGWGVIQDKVDLKGTGIIILAEKDKKLEIVKDFATLTNENVNRVKPPVLVRQRLYVHPRTGDLYVAEGDSGVNKSFKQLVRVSPDKMANNKNDYQLVELPLTAEEMAIGHDGFFYLKTEYNIVRYDPSTWKEVPFDYGTEKRKVGFDDTKMASAVSSITLPATGKHGGWWHSGGFAVSVKGDIAASCYNTATKKGLVQGDENYYSKKDAGGAEQTYTPLLYPGRKTDFEIHIWDKFGQKKVEDAFPGSTLTNGFQLDKDGNLFVLINENKLINGQPYFVKWASSFVKVKAGKAKMISAGGNVPVPIAKDAYPKRPQDFVGGWIEDKEWMYGGVGFNGLNSGASCICWNARPAVDFFSRSFLPEVDHFSVAVLDTNGNLIMRLGQYGNVDDGKPLVEGFGPKKVNSIGGDEVAIFHAAYLATFSDKRLFISDGGNSRILSVKLDYHKEFKQPLANLKR